MSARSRSPRGKRRPSATPEAVYIEDLAALRACCDRLRDAGRFAFDTEFVMEDRFQSEVCLVQVATDDLVAVIDPFEVQELGPIWELVADPDVEVIVHAGMEDLALSFNSVGSAPQRIFDCQVACGLVTTDYPLSLSRMVRQHVGVRLHKSQTLTDWRRRPLSEEQIQYAADDVAYLPAVHTVLARDLQQRGRTGWMDEEMQRFSLPATYAKDTATQAFKLKGAGSLDGRGIAVARELVKARKELAAEYDRPERAVIRDHLVVEIARHRVSSTAQIKNLRGLHLRLPGIRALATAVERALEIPEDQLPTPPPPPPPDESDQEAAVSLLISAALHAWRADSSVAHQLVASRKDVRAFVHNRLVNNPASKSISLQSGWRAESVGAVLEDVLAGRRSVRLKHKGQQWSIVLDGI